MNIQDKPLTELLSKIGSSVYDASEGLPEEEKWAIQSKLRNRSTDAISWGAEAQGSIDPRDIAWAFGKARASLFVVKATYKHACDVRLLAMDPSIMAWTDQAIKSVDAHIDTATAGIPDWFKQMDSSNKGEKK